MLALNACESKKYVSTSFSSKGQNLFLNRAFLLICRKTHICGKMEK